MQAFEKQLQSIGDKSALHDWIDSMPDEGVTVLFLAQYDDRSRYNTFGQPTNERTTTRRTREAIRDCR
jgi:hypothetical protein